MKDYANYSTVSPLCVLTLEVLQNEEFRIHAERNINMSGVDVTKLIIAGTR